MTRSESIIYFKYIERVILVDSADEFKSLLESSEKLVVDFWKEGCQKCNLMAPYYRDMSEEFPNITFAKVENSVQGIMNLLDNIFL